MRGRRRLFATLFASAVAVAAVMPARAQDAGQAEPAPTDLRAALRAAYATNPTLTAARENQRATDEGVPLARADGLPSLSATASETEFVKQNPLQTPAPLRIATVTATLSVPLYSGGAVRSAVRAAQVRVAAGKASLAGSEAQVFSQVVAAYMDVILNSEVVRFNAANVDMLSVNLKATQDRFQIGDLTRTDVAQSQSRLALAQGDQQTAQSNLIAAREQFIAVVGRVPGDLAPPPPLPGLPASADAAVAIALEANPDLAAARQNTHAAHYDVGTARAIRLPKISLFADGEHDDYLGSLSISAAALGGYTGPIPEAATTADVGIRATIPLYQGGRPAAQIRAAQAREGAAFDNEIGTERNIIATVRSAWASWAAAQAIIASTQTALDAAQLSLRGVKAENSVGNRTILDILNAEQEVVNAEVQLVTAQRNAYVAGFTLLAAMGRAGAVSLGIDSGEGGTGPLYDPDAHFRATRAPLWDWASDAAPPSASGAGPAFLTATPTRDTPAQTAATVATGKS